MSLGDDSYSLGRFHELLRSWRAALRTYDAHPDAKRWRRLPPRAKGQAERQRLEYRQKMAGAINMAAEFLALKASPDLAWNVADKMVRARKTRRSRGLGQKERPSDTLLMEAAGALSDFDKKTAPKHIAEVLADTEFAAEAHARSRTMLAEHILDRANVVLRQCPNPRAYCEECGLELPEGWRGSRHIPTCPPSSRFKSKSEAAGYEPED